MKDIVSFIQQIGFPAFVALYVLVRLEPLIQSNTEAINKLAVVISNLSQVDGTELSEQLNDNN
ncbi:YvrJ family protein [Sporohalobacter salinus]|uniref:YvrJ family protein n=1 Tax=Sporohalobacter salinus TaxID=1494606 RepID=UPI0019600366|nr:YvrJ family protein [Sporohalobacter salinus]MBM7623705.1 hypothetical protein [Sporohalobacter salinus]